MHPAYAVKVVTDQLASGDPKVHLFNVAMGERLQAFQCSSVKQAASRSGGVAYFNFEKSSTAGTCFLLLVGGQAYLIDLEANAQGNA